MTKQLNHCHISDSAWCTALPWKTPAILLKWRQKQSWRGLQKIWGNVGRRSVCEVGEVRTGSGGAQGQGCKTSTWHHTHQERASLSALLLSSPLRTCFPGPHFLTGCLVWVTGCWLPVYWEGTDSKVKARHPVECREGGGGGGGGVVVLHKHITWNSEAHSIVPCAISAVSCCELCLSYISAGAAFISLAHTSWSKQKITWRRGFICMYFMDYLSFVFILFSSIILPVLPNRIAVER